MTVTMVARVMVIVVVIVTVIVSLLQKRPSCVSPVQMQMLWHFGEPLGTSTMAPLWLDKFWFHG